MCEVEIARLLSRVRVASGAVVRCSLPTKVTRRQRLVSYTDGGPFVYTIQETGVLVQLAADYLSRLDRRYGYVELVRIERALVARLEGERGLVESYLIARSVYNLAADGHFGSNEFEHVEFQGFDADVDIGLLPLGQVSDAMEGSVRAMPARGPSPLDRLAEWQLVSMKGSRVYDRDYVFQKMCDITNTSPMPAQASIPVYGRSGSIASLDLENGAGTMFMEAFVTRPDDNIAQATTLGSYISLGAAARGPKEGITIAFPAADPICVYTVETEHWLLSGNERVWVHLHSRTYVFATHGVTIPTAMGGGFALLRQVYSANPLPHFGLRVKSPSERAWAARGSLSMYTWHVPLMLSRIHEACAAVVIVVSKRHVNHAMCGVFVLSAVSGERRKATLLVRGHLGEDAESEHRAALNKMQNAYDLTIESVEVPRQNETQGAEGSCTVHALMHALFLVDVHCQALLDGDAGKLRGALQEAAPVEYALACTRALRLEPESGALEEYRCGSGSLFAYVEPTGGIVLTAVDALGTAQTLGDDRDRCVGAFRGHLRSKYALAQTVTGLAPFAWWTRNMPSVEGGPTGFGPGIRRYV